MRVETEVDQEQIPLCVYAGLSAWCGRRGHLPPPQHKDRTTGYGPRTTGCDPVGAGPPAGRGTARGTCAQLLAATEAT